MTAATAPKEIHRLDYKPFPYAVDTLKLDFVVHDTETIVTSTMKLTPRHDTRPNEPLFLHGEDLELRSISLDGTPLPADAYTLTDEGLTLLAPPAAAFELVSTVAIQPAKNTQLSGLYQSSGNLCTQCEAEGFRRITYFPDRPDVMTVYKVRVEADKARFPVLLSNGNEVAKGACAGAPERHWAEFEDPFRKPSYLFALVAGNLGGISSEFVTCSGRKVDLKLWSEFENLDQLDWAMQSLKDSMAWDEKAYGREYDLDVYHIVAVSDFNMGAMENKGLNVFNTACVLAKPSTATDGDYERVQGVVAHEYFHNWSGNRVTCRDWFQLTLKEGFTVFRDQHFSADMTSEAVKRIEDVRIMRSAQFLQDAGPMAHPIRPESYIAMDNFYTVTVYNKGAEVIRMYRELLGKEGFRKGTDLYFERHDGQAVTCDDFRAAMADANGADLGHFERWYTQAGTPTVAVAGAYDAAAGTYALTLTQSTPATPGQPTKQPFHIPVAVGLLGAADGAELVATRVLELKEASQTFEFKVPAEPVPSVLRGFSAPVRVEQPRTAAQLAFFAKYDTDPFNKWDASQRLATSVLLSLAEALPPKGDAAAAAAALPADFVDAWRATLTDDKLDPSLRAYSLTLPDFGTLSQEVKVVDPAKLCGALGAARLGLASALRAELKAVYASLAPPAGAAFTIEPEAVGNRRLRNVCLAYLAKLGDAEALGTALTQFREATCMTDSLAAASALAPHAGSARDEALGAFYQRAKENKEALVINKWFAMQASADTPDALAAVKALLSHEAYDGSNPNRVRSVISTFAGANPAHFHAADGSGYEFIGTQTIELDKRNPQVAARLCGAFGQWRRYEPALGALMKAQLERVKATDGVSKDTFEIAARSLA